jgi:hypothetical protein
MAEIKIFEKFTLVLCDLRIADSRRLRLPWTLTRVNANLPERNTKHGESPLFEEDWKPFLVLERHSPYHLKRLAAHEQGNKNENL